jgi:hypothetical protein
MARSVMATRVSGAPPCHDAGQAATDDRYHTAKRAFVARLACTMKQFLAPLRVSHHCNSYQFRGD